MAETKPTKVGQWATNANRTLEPALGEKQVGWEVVKKAPARFMNWLHNVAYLWHNWLNERAFDGASSKDFELRGVDIVAGTDVDGGDLEIGGGSSTGDGGSVVTVKVAKANQGAGAAVRTPAQVAVFDEDGLLKSEGIESTAAITNGPALKGTGDGSGPGVEAIGGATGYALTAQADTTSPARGSLRLVSQDTAPTVVNEAGAVSLVGTKPQHSDGVTFDRFVMQSFALAPVADVLASVTGWTSFATTYSIPANTLKIGSTIRVHAACEITNRTSGTLQFRIQIDGNVVITSLTSAVDGDVATLQAIMVVVSIGSPGATIGGGIASIGTPNGAGAISQANEQDTPVTTGALVVDVQVNPSISDANNEGTLNSLVVDVL